MTKLSNIHWATVKWNNILWITPIKYFFSSPSSYLPSWFFVFVSSANSQHYIQPHCHYLPTSKHKFNPLRFLIKRQDYAIECDWIYELFFKSTDIQGGEFYQPFFICWSTVDDFRFHGLYYSTFHTTQSSLSMIDKILRKPRELCLYSTASSVVAMKINEYLGDEGNQS